jgi:ATP-dependent Clp protease, protease subunit
MENIKDLKEALIQEIFSSQELQVWDPHEHKYFGPSTRSIPFYGDVNEDRARLLISQILHLETLSQEEEITIYLNTPGGSLTDGLAIYDVIKEVSCPVVVVAQGLCASAGLLIMAAADYKMASKNTIFFYHQPVVSDSSINSMNDMLSFSNHYEYCKDISDSIILESSKMRKTLWKKFFAGQTSFYFNTDKAIEFKIIDEIIVSRKLSFKITRD